MMIFSIILCALCVYFFFWGAQWRYFLHWLCGKNTDDIIQCPLNNAVADSLETKVELKRGCLCISIQGTVEAPSSQHQINICIELNDLTEPDAVTSCVHSLSDQFKHPITGTFAYQQHKGALPEKQTRISDWMEVANIDTADLRFARMGTRRLLFKVFVISCASRQELAAGSVIILYDNLSPGYMDMAYNAFKAGKLAVILALSNVEQISNEQVDTAASWFQQNVAAVSEHIPKPGRDQIEKAIKQARKFLRHGHTLDIAQICGQIKNIADTHLRLDIMDLCLRIGFVNGCVAERSLATINRIAWLLEIEYADYIRKLESKLASHETARYSAQLLLGIVPEMDEQCVCRLLNDEYRRWNGCVTSFDAAIRKRALEMIERITRVRNEYRSRSLTGAA